MPKISIIIPFNNVETYIEKCLTSVVNQTLKDIEIICVNDASDDNSRNIVESFQKEDSRIKIIDIETRQGQGYARNRALEIAQGEYIGFVDSDDWIETDMFQELYNKAKENDNDITICQAREYDDINEKFIISDYYSLTILNRMEDKVFSAEDTKDELLDINVVLWNKIYKREYLLKINEKFPEGFIYEDLPFFFGTYLSAKKIQIVWKNLYIYRINRKNSTMLQFNNKVLDRIPMVSLTYEKLKRYDFLNDIQKKIQGWIINDLFHRYTLLKEKCQKEYFFLMKKVFLSLDIQDINDTYWQQVYHFKGYLLVINNSFDDFNQKLFKEYLDIHEVENRLRYSSYEKSEIDKKITRVYEEITKNYEYTNNLNNKAIDKINIVEDSSNKKIYEINNTITNNFNSKIQDINNEIKNIYEEITFNYDKSVEIFSQNIEKLKNEIKSDILNCQDNFKKLSSNLEEKINYIEQDLNNKNNYTNAKIDEKITGLNNNINNKISSLYEKLSNDYSEITNLIENASNTLKKEIELEEAKNTSEIKEIINLNKVKTEEAFEEKYKDIIKHTKEEKETLKSVLNKEIEETKAIFENKLELQKSDYDYQIKLLKEKIEYLSKSPLEKFIEKMKKKK